MKAQTLMNDIILSVKLGLHFKEIEAMCHNSGIHNIAVIKTAYMHAYKLANNNG